jgi:hypothetical protein
LRRDLAEVVGAIEEVVKLIVGESGGRCAFGASLTLTFNAE